MEKSTGKGLFIAIEGVDGSGKSTIIEMLKKDFPDFVYSREPGGTPVAELTRNVILSPETGESSRTVQALLFAAGRRDHVEKKIQPALNEGKWVVTDRYFLSSLSYQYDSPEIFELIRIGTNGLHPDITFILDVDYETAQERLKASGKATDHLDNESKESFGRRRDIMKRYYLGEFEGCKPSLCYFINAVDSVESIYQSIKEAISLQLH